MTSTLNTLRMGQPNQNIKSEKVPVESYPESKEN